MLNKNFGKVVSLAICACMAWPWQVPAMAFVQAGSSADADTAAVTATLDNTTTVPQDYQRQSVPSLYDAGQFRVDNASVTLSKDEASGNLLVSGSRKALTSSTFSISKTFDFSSAAVGRVSVSGLAQYGKKVELAFYLDSQTEPFFTTQLKTQEQDEDKWDDPMESSANILPLNVTGQHTINIKIASCSPSPEFCLEYIEFAESSVPMLNLDIDESLGTIADMNLSEHHTVNCYGTVSIDVPQGYTSAITGKELAGTNGSIDLSYIRGRGNTTWREVKKPYKLKLDSSANLLGMGKNKNWALLANSMDPSDLRNYMTSWMGQELGMPYTYSCEPVEVIMNGEYLGSYMLVESVRVGSSRVDIADLDETPEATDEATISGGYLLSLGNWTLDSDKLNFTTKKAKGVFQVESPDLYTSKNTTQLDYIKSYVQKVENAIYKGGDYASLMDVESAAKYFWFEELSANGDGFTSGSCYLYKDRGGKLCWGPLWDFDLSWGAGDGDGEVSRSWSQTDKFWNERLFQDQGYVDVVKAQWPSFRAMLIQAITAGGAIDELAASVRTSVLYNNEHWGLRDESKEWETEEATLEQGALFFDESVESLRSWVTVREQWVDGNLSSLDPKPAKVTFKGSDGKTVTAKTVCVGHAYGSFPKAPAKKGYTFMGWKHVYKISWKEFLKKKGMTKKQFRTYLIKKRHLTAAKADKRIAALKKGKACAKAVKEEDVVKGNITLTATYKKTSGITKITKIRSTAKTYNCVYNANDNATLLNIPTMVFPGVRNGNRIDTIIGDESIIGVGYGSEFLVKRPGTTTITFKPLRGKSLTVKVRVYSQEEADEKCIESAEPEFAKKSITIAAGKYVKLPLKAVEKGTDNSNLPKIGCTNSKVLKVNQAGYVYGKKAGTAVVYFVKNDSVQHCTITVKKGKRK